MLKIKCTVDGCRTDNGIEGYELVKEVLGACWDCCNCGTEHIIKLDGSIETMQYYLQKISAEMTGDNRTHNFIGIDI